MLSIGTYGQQDLLYCIDGLGKRTEVVDDEGNTVTIYEKGPEALGMFLLFLPIGFSLSMDRMHSRFTKIFAKG